MKSKGRVLKGKPVEIDEKKVTKDDSKHTIFRHSPVCGDCVYFIVENLFNKSTDFQKTCVAFPKGIPDEIWKGSNKHTSDFEGDQGLHYKKATKKDTIDVLKKYINEGGESADYAESLLRTITKQAEEEE